MTKDEIIEMAKEAGLLPCQGIHRGDLKAFAKLVAAKEREACAELIEKETGLNPNWQKYLSAAIRARGQA
jgi:hypothetical protein